MRGWRSLGNDASLHNKGSLFTLMLGPPGKGTKIYEKYQHLGKASTLEGYLWK